MEETEKGFGQYYLAIQENGETILYKSERFALDEIDLINLIKILLVQKRAVNLGKKILAVYTDSTSHKKEQTIKNLKGIGLNYEEEKPERSRKSKSR
jgi:UDP-N-acetylglucosamine 2-epimerase